MYLSESDPRIWRGSGSETTVTNVTLMNLTSIIMQLLSVSEEVGCICRGVSEVSGNYSGPSVQQHTMYCSLIPGCTQHSASTYMYIVQSLRRMHVWNALYGR